VDEAEKVRDLFCKKVMGVPLASANGACEGTWEANKKGKQ
jgi:hypothetical protein